MLKLFLILFIFISLTSCNNDEKNIKKWLNYNTWALFQNEIISDYKTGNLSVVNDRLIENKINLNIDLYNKTTKITFNDPKDIENFENKLQEVNEDIENNTWSLSLDQIFDKAKYLDYLGQTWKALEIYEQNFDENINAMSLAYNHNMAKLYETLWAYDDAMIRYEFLIRYFNRPDYLRDVANLWKIIWNEKKYEEVMNTYNTKYRKIDTNTGSQIN
jgi:tetratricopeptide (TPR) repeat protein